MNEVKIFTNEQFGEIRTLALDNEPHFVASDLCKALGYLNSRDAIARHVDEADVVKHDIRSSGQKRVMTLINESGMYSLVLGSKLKQAKEFKRWGISEVLPSIRKHGGYLTADKIEEALNDPDTLIRLATSLKEERAERQRLEKLRKEDAPRVLLAKAIEDCEECCLVDVLAKVLKQNGVNIGQNRLFKWLHENKYLCVKGGDRNSPTQRAMNLKVFRIVACQKTLSNGKKIIVRTTKITSKGLKYFTNKFLSQVK